MLSSLIVDIKLVFKPTIALNEGPTLKPLLQRHALRALVGLLEVLSLVKGLEDDFYPLACPSELRRTYA